jgi:hypothetical protein
MYFLTLLDDATGLVAGNQHWGHATSQDLYHWTNQPIALFPPNNFTYVFSGSAVVDVNNTSGFFPNQTNGVYDLVSKEVYLQILTQEQCCDLHVSRIPRRRSWTTTTSHFVFNRWRIHIYFIFGKSCNPKYIISIQRSKSYLVRRPLGSCAGIRPGLYSRLLHITRSEELDPCI